MPILAKMCIGAHTTLVIHIRQGPVAVFPCQAIPSYLQAACLERGMQMLCPCAAFLPCLDYLPHCKCQAYVKALGLALTT